VTAVAHGEWTPTDEDNQTLDLTEQRAAIDGDRDRARYVTRVAHAANLRLMGLPWQRVADEAGYASRGAAFTSVMGYLRRQADESVAELREQESARLDRAAAAIYNKVLQGDARAQDTWLRNRASYRLLNGLNAPVQVALSSGAQAAMYDALSEVEALVMGQVLDRKDDPAVEVDPTEEDRHG